MKSETWATCKLSYLDKLKQEIEQISKMPDPVFSEIKIDCRDIHDDNCVTQWEPLLRNIGINKETSVLYFFSFDPVLLENILEKAKEQKKVRKVSTEKVYRAMSKINTKNRELCKGVLYVGKTNSNFLSRFTHHLGLVKSDTYALQLKYWATEFKLSLFVAPMKLQPDEVYYLEHLETALHNSLHPLLGRSGH